MSEKIYNINEVANKIPRLPLDSHIRGTFLGGIYTHNSPDKEQMFLMEQLVDDKWVTCSFYCIGARSLINTINTFDLKEFKKRNNETK